jgi:hypothetical protein
MGAGMMGSNSCYNSDGTFNPSIFCLQELFTGAGGNEKGTLYPAKKESADALLKMRDGAPSLDATATYLNELGYKAIYGKDENGNTIPFADYVDAAMKMTGTTPKNLCDGPNVTTGPHTPICLDYLWRTSGNLSDSNTDTRNLPYSYCSKNGSLAPLKLDGSPNDENIALANDQGSASAVRSYYKSIYDGTQNSTNFPVWANTMLQCHNTRVPVPPFDPDSCSDGKSNIVVTEASYGVNCNSSLRGNRTELFQELTRGKPTLQYAYEYTKTGGDTAPGCGKTLEVKYNCQGGPTYKLTVPPEAGLNGQVNIDCANPLATSSLA